MATTQSTRVRRAVQRYAASFDELRGVTDAYVALVTRLLDDAGINYLAVTGRTKSVESFAGKAARRLPGGRMAHPKPLIDITDQVGVRVVTYVLADVDAVAQLLSSQLEVHEDRDMGQETAAAGRFGYSSRHLLVGLGDDREEGGIPRERPASVQIRTAPARLGRVRARRALQGLGLGRARTRLRPPLHPRSRVARCTDPGR